MRISKLTSGERLRREGPTQAPTEETFDGDLIVVGTSAGGHHALEEIVRDLPAGIPAAVVILIHGRLGSDYTLKEFLQRFTRIPIVLVHSSERLRQQTIFILPSGKSASFDNGMMIVEEDNFDRPLATIDRLFQAAARVYRERVIGVILSGAMKDGTDGLRAVHEAGGLTIVQNPTDAEYPDMPANAMEHLPVTFCLDLSEIGGALELLARRKAQFETGLAVALRSLQARAKLLVKLAEQSDNPGTHEFLMNEVSLLKGQLQSVEGLVEETFRLAEKRWGPGSSEA